MHAAKRTSTAVRAAIAGAALAALLAVPANALASSHCRDANANPNTTSLKRIDRATLCLLNQQRRAHGLRPLRQNHDLSLASLRHARNMAVHDYFAHGDFVGRIRAAHYLKRTHGWMLGENIAWGSWEYATPASIVDGWMHSPPHRANILNGRFREIGIGVTRGAPAGGVDRAATYATDFGTRY